MPTGSWVCGDRGNTVQISQDETQVVRMNGIHGSVGQRLD